ncbi:cation acetate symporter [Streptomyces sp. NPDC058411]|uniref:sodium:solute symporter family transporter n=1 Tax=Streptomyces sp. NPDC058411 TaxID=3346485 RepID=UPI00365002E2
MTDRADQILAAESLGAVPLVAFLLIVCFVVLMYLLYGADSDGPADVYVARQSVRPVRNALALAGDHISVITLLTTTGTVTLAGYDGMALAISTAVSLGVLLLLAQPLRNIGQFTLGDTLGARFPGRAARVAGTVATLCFCLPLTVVQLVVAGAAVSFLLGLSDTGGAAQVCTALIGAIMICAACLSGMRGNSILQTIKTVVLLAAMTVLGVQVMDAFGWNVNSLLDTAARNSTDPSHYYDPGLFQGDGATGGLSRFSMLLTMALGAAVGPHMLMRLNASDRGESARRAVTYAIGPVTIFCGLAVLLGFGATALVGSEAIRAADPQGLAALPLLALQLAADGSAGGMIIALTVSMFFLTGLTVVAALTLSAAASLAHDVFADGEGRDRGATSEMRALHWSAIAVGALAVALAVALQGREVTFLAQFAITAAAAAILPTLVFELFWSGYTRAGMLWSVYGGLGTSVFLQLFGPAVSGSPTSVLPGADFSWFPLEATGLVSIPVGFLTGWAASRITASGSTTGAAYKDMERRALTGS